MEREIVKEEIEIVEEGGKITNICPNAHCRSTMRCEWNGQNYVCPLCGCEWRYRK